MLRIKKLKILGTSFLVILFLIIGFSVKTHWKSFVNSISNYAFAATFQSNSSWSSSNSGNWNDVATWGINFYDPLTNSTNIKISSTDNVYIDNQNGNEKIVSFSPNLAYLSVYPGSYANPSLPSDIDESIYYNNKRYVLESTADYLDYYINIYNPDNSLYSSIDLGNDGGPNLINVIPNTGEIYVFFDDHVDVLNPDGTASTTITRDCGLFCGNTFFVSQNEIYAYDTNSGQSVLFNADGTASTTYNGKPSRPINFSNNGGTAFDTQGEKYVAQGGGGHVLVYNLDGSASTTTYTIPNTTYSMQMIALSPDGKMYIVDMYAQDWFQITVLNPDGSLFAQQNHISIPSLDAGIDYPGISDDVTINKGTTILSEDESVHNLTLASGGTLDLGGHTLNISGNWSNTGGTLITNHGTVNFVSTTTQSISGSNTFENLVKNATTSSSLLFDTTGVTTITNTISLSGILNNLLTIGPTATATSVVFNKIINKVGPADLTNPGGMSLSPSGDIYVTDPNNHRVVVFNSGGLAYKVLSDSTLSTPTDVAVSSSGYVYVVDNTGNRIVVFNPDGTFSKTYDALGLSSPQNILISPISGELYITDSGNNRIVVAEQDGTASTTYEGLGLSGPRGLSFDSSGNIYIADTGNGRVIVLNPDGAASTTAPTYINACSDDVAVAPNGYLYISCTYGGVITFAPDGTLTSQSYGYHPTAVKFDSFGNLYTSDANNPVNIYQASGGFPSDSMGENFLGRIAGYISSPTGIAVDPSGYIYVADHSSTYGSQIEKFDTAGNFVKFIDSNQFGILGGLTVDTNHNLYITSTTQTPFLNKIIETDSSGNFIRATSTDPDFPLNIAVDVSGNVYVSLMDQFGHSNLVKLDNNLNYITSTTTANNTALQFYYGGLAIDPTNTYLYVADDWNDRVVKLNASDLSYVDSTSGPSEAPFSTPSAVSTDAHGNIYVVDSGGNQIIKLASDFSYITSWGSYGSGNDNFSNPAYIGLDSSGNVYISDLYNYSIKKFSQSTPVFDILKTGTGSSTFSYLSVSGSTNQSASAFTCNNCTDGGSNTNWIFSSSTTTVVTPVITSQNTGGGYSGSVVTEEEEPASDITTNNSATTTATTTEESEATTTEAVATTTATTTISRIPATFCFNKDLVQYSSDPDVKYLQIFLNEQGFPSIVAGNENDYFGSKTIEPLINFQEKYAADILTPSGLTSGNGQFLSATRNKVDEILGCTPILASTTTKPVIEKGIPPVVTTPTEPSTIETVPPVPTENVQTQESSAQTTSSGNESSAPIASENAGFSNGIVQNYQNAVAVTKVSLQQVQKAINTKTGSIVTKTISTVGVISGSAVAVSAVVFSGSVSFSELWLIPTRLFGLLLGALGIRRKQRPWGTVYDSVTKRPLDPAYVSLVNITTGKEVASAITDLDGRYGFMVLPGTYNLIAQKTNYTYPSLKMQNRPFDEVYNDLYYGTEVTIASEGEIITKNIPMDPQGFDWNEFAKNKMNVTAFVKEKDIVWARISKVFFALGSLAAFVGVLFAPAPYNFIIALLYIAIYILNYVVFKTKKSGTITEKNTNTPLSFAIVNICREGEDMPLAKKITDTIGHYYILLPKGRYYLAIQKKNDDGSYAPAQKTQIFDVKKGILNFDVQL